MEFNFNIRTDLWIFLKLENWKDENNKKKQQKEKI